MKSILSSLQAGGALWLPNVCSNFCDIFLQHIKDVVHKNDPRSFLAPCLNTGREWHPSRSWLVLFFFSFVEPWLYSITIQRRRRFITSSLKLKRIPSTISSHSDTLTCTGQADSYLLTSSIYLVQIVHALSHYLVGVTINCVYSSRWIICLKLL